MGCGEKKRAGKYLRALFFFFKVDVLSYNRIVFFNLQPFGGISFIFARCIEM